MHAADWAAVSKQLQAASTASNGEAPQVTVAHEACVPVQQSPEGEQRFPGLYTANLQATLLLPQPFCCALSAAIC